MSDANVVIKPAYSTNFLKEVEANVEEGKWVKMCMQCGVCSGSCPLGKHWSHPPQEIFMLIRAGRREMVLNSDAMWLCTSCYNCMVRCPRGLPITHIMHGLAHYAKRLGLVPRHQPTAQFAQLFWDNLMRKGRVNELKLGLRLYFMNGFVNGINVALKQRTLGLAMLKTRRMHLGEMFGGHGVKDVVGFRSIMAKAQALENARLNPPVN